MQISLRSALGGIGLLATLLASIHNALWFAVSLPLLAAVVSIGEDRFVSPQVSRGVIGWLQLVSLGLLAFLVASVCVPAVRG